MPKRHILFMGKMLGHFLYFFDVHHRRIVRRNLHFSYPEWSQSQIQNLSKRIFQNYGIIIFEVLQMAFSTREEMLSRKWLFPLVKRC
jgi:lauroyl/myristoyl acyltransferase